MARSSLDTSHCATCHSAPCSSSPVTIHKELQVALNSVSSNVHLLLTIHSTHITMLLASRLICCDTKAVCGRVYKTRTCGCCFLESYQGLLHLVPTRPYLARPSFAPNRPEAFAATAITTLQQLAASCMQDAEQDMKNEGADMHPTPGVHEEASEIMYIWALAEAYCMHPLLQETMRYDADHCTWPIQE